MNCVADASYVAGWLLPDEATPAKLRLLAAIEAGRVDLHVPHLWIYELGNLLLMAHRRNRVTAPQLAEAEATYAAVRCAFHDQTDAVCRHRIMHMAQGHGLTAYDAAYLELADRLRAPLLTEDTLLLKAARNEKVGTVLEI
jgi:predicted nucleic acid-binding protein